MLQRVEGGAGMIATVDHQGFVTATGRGAQARPWRDR
jgi:hypothetical protein